MITAPSFGDVFLRAITGSHAGIAESPGGEKPPRTMHVWKKETAWRLARNQKISHTCPISIFPNLKRTTRLIA
jgi:hypothetical protein